MKPMLITLEQIASYDNLTLALYKAAKGKKQQANIKNYLQNSGYQLELLVSNILQEKSPVGKVQKFVIHDPKRREITAACFADRVLHHAIMNLTQGSFEKALLPSVYACRPGKGVHSAEKAVQQGLQKWPFYVQVDVANYFAQINHVVLEKMLAKRFTGQAFLRLLKRIIQATDPHLTGKGLPIGSLMSQHWANHYLNQADRLLLNQHGVTAHVRYMDDIIWFCQDKTIALHTLEILKDFLTQELHLSLKPNPTIASSSKGVLFCGFKVKQGIILPSPRKLKKARASFKIIKHAENNHANEQDLQRAFSAWQAALLPAQAANFTRRVWSPQ